MTVRILPSAPHFERCICPTFNKVFAAGTAVLFGSHCQACKTGGMMLEILPMDAEERIEERAGRLKLVGCTRWPVCKNKQWAYFDADLEHSDKRNFDEAKIWGWVWKGDSGKDAEEL